MFALMLFLVFVGPVSTYLTEVLPEFITKPITIEMHDQVLITLLMLVIFVMVYTFIPSGKRSFLRQIPGALLDAVVWIIFSELFSIYVEGNNAYSMFYGSLEITHTACFTEALEVSLSCSSGCIAASTLCSSGRFSTGSAGNSGTSWSDF